MEKTLIRNHRELDAFQLAFEAAMNLFELSKAFLVEERYSLTDQVRRSSRSVCANLAEAWRKRRYEAAFVLALSHSEAEAAETQVWIEFAVKCGYLDRDKARDLYSTYDHILGKLVQMISKPEPWLLQKTKSDHMKTQQSHHPSPLLLCSSAPHPPIWRNN